MVTMLHRCIGLFGLFIIHVSLAAPATQLRTWPQKKAAALSSVQADIQVINVWATWCAPCRREIPVLSRWFVQQPSQRIKLSVVGIAVDNEANLQRFTREIKVSYPIWQYIGADSTSWMRSLGNNVGALPFTLVQAPQCGFRQTILGALTTQKLNQTVKAARRQCHMA